MAVPTPLLPDPVDVPAADVDLNSLEILQLAPIDFYILHMSIQMKLGTRWLSMWLSPPLPEVPGLRVTE